VLVLTRKQQQSIVIGNDITVTILEVHGDQVRVGIDAPRDVTVNRQEIAERIRESNAGAAASARMLGHRSHSKGA